MKAMPGTLPWISSTTAAGDCAEAFDAVSQTPVVSAIQPNAADQARIAATNMARDLVHESCLNGVLAITKVQVFADRLEHLGHQLLGGAVAVLGHRPRVLDLDRGAAVAGLLEQILLVGDERLCCLQSLVLKRMRTKTQTRRAKRDTCI